MAVVQPTQDGALDDSAPGLLASMGKKHDEQEWKRRYDAAVSELKDLIQSDRTVGDLISMDYNTAEVLIHDKLRQDVGGVPHGCLLLATRIRPETEELDLDAPQTSVILLRSLKSSPLPNDIEMKQARMEAGQRVAQTLQHWDDSTVTDQFTLNQMRYAGAHCRILGTLRMNLIEEETGPVQWRLEFGGDIDNFYAGQGMKVYKLGHSALSRIVNYTRMIEEDARPVQIGRIRYAAAIRQQDTAESVSVQMIPQDLIAQRSALFGMTRTGKSNTTKTIAKAVFQLRLTSDGQRVGQLIFDPNGEYANENPQDQGCIRNVANIPGAVKSDVVTYGLQSHPNDPDRNITKFNFYGAELRGQNPGKAEMDEALQSLYQGKAIIDQALAEENTGYVRSFISSDITAPPDVDEYNTRTRYRRALLAYKAILNWAGFEPPGKNILIKGLFNSKLIGLMKTDDDMKSYGERLETEDYLPWDVASSFCEALSEWVSSRKFKDFDNSYSKDRKWSDDRFLGLLRIFENTRGREIIRQTRQWHGLNSDTDYADEIVEHIRKGRLVIFDQALGDPEMNKQAAQRIVRGIFRSQQQAFIAPEKDPDTGEYMKPPPVLIYIEEAHTLLPKGSESDTGNIWARIAKEGSKFNIGMVYSTQEPSTIQTNILKNTENWFIAHLNNTDEVRELSKYNDFTDFAESIIKVNEIGFLRVRTRSSPYTLPVQIDKFTAPISSSQPNSSTSLNGQTNMLQGSF